MHGTNQGILTLSLKIIGILSLLFSAYVAISYLYNPIIDGHAFRQTQTAISAYWMIKEGIKFPYQTPILGYPWEIPLEFPIYQYITSVVAKLGPLGLEPTGRLVSYLFLLGCCWPAYEVSKRLGLSTRVNWIFFALLFTSPTYIFWGRSFMIETAATFFAVACIPYAIDISRGSLDGKSIAAFLFFACMGILQKATTTGPVLLFFAGVTIVSGVQRSGIRVSSLKRCIIPCLIICLPVLVGLIWTIYSDAIKENHPFGNHLTSSALRVWTFGRIQQRVEPTTWSLIVWQRSFIPNAGGAMGILLLIAAWISTVGSSRPRILSLASVALFFLPFLIFTPLHVVHDYYQVANVIFLLYAIAIVVGEWIPSVTRWKALVPVVTLLFVISNVSNFKSNYWHIASRTLDQQDPGSQKAYRIGTTLKELTGEESAIVVFGQGYSSVVAYHERWPQKSEQRCKWIHCLT